MKIWIELAIQTKTSLTDRRLIGKVSPHFMAELVGNLLVGQSGGPTAVINASLAGVIQEAGRHECIEEIYGGLNGILGMLNEDLIDINEEKRTTIEVLNHPPPAALAPCR